MVDAMVAIRIMHYSRDTQYVILFFTLLCYITPFSGSLF